MFWGLILDSNKKYTQVIETNFHVSMASLDVSKSSNDFVQVSVFYDNTSYLLCSLKKDLLPQQPLDLNFEAGSQISFSCNGSGRVHLTGFLVRDEEEDDEMFGPMDDSDEQSDDEQVPDLVPMDKKRKAKGDKNDSSKKLKLEQSVDDSDESDSDADMETTLQGDSDDSDEDEDDEEDEDEEQQEQSDDDESSDEEAEEKVTKKPAKVEVVANGKEAKQGKEGKQKKNKDKNKDKSKTEEKPEQQQQKQLVQQQLQKKKVIEGGVQIEDIKVGNGTPAKPGKFVGVYYVGRLKNGKKFDQTLNGEGFKFRLGKGEVIKGWDVGIAGMKVGGKRRITVPPGMGYGAKGSPPVIPPNSQLIFEIELKHVN